ncbi:M20 family peptidase [Ramlibacter monticola]|uniref:M20 family peptidase n=2 Tax=Ramlibacter monticola TaxID=1926872 RepID=A0A936YZA5_9BURK|nr:M20 family peptidase [Ramlibacter monticola]
MIKRAVLVLAALVLLLAAVLAANTLRQGSRQLDVPPAPPLAVDAQAVAEKLAGAVRLRTIASREDPSLNADEFRRLHAWLEQRFPLVHARLQREVVGGLSLLYTWRGSDPNAKAVALLAHQDVVPVAPGTEAAWQAPPFAGVVRDGFVWGRGAWDDKGNLVAQLEAIEMLLGSGFQPRPTVYLVSGADEEVSGERGAQQVVKLLQQRQVRLDFVLDEGLVITEGMVPGVQAPVALVGTAEKGYASFLLKVRTQGGHSSLPPAPGASAIAQLAEALRRLDREQLPAALEGVAREMFETTAPEMRGFQRVALSNLWLFGPLVRAQLEKTPGSNAMLRTTTALTVLRAGEKENVLPAEAEAVLNFRILPGESRASVRQHVQARVGEGFSVEELPGGYEPTPVTSTRSASYQQIQRTLRSLFPEVVVAPALYVAGSDSRLFVPIADHIYRFSPVRARSEDLQRLHGTNERIAVAALADMVRFYHQLLRNLNAPTA